VLGRFAMPRAKRNGSETKPKVPQTRQNTSATRDNAAATDNADAKRRAERDNLSAPEYFKHAGNLARAAQLLLCRTYAVIIDNQHEKPQICRSNISTK